MSPIPEELARRLVERGVLEPTVLTLNERLAHHRAEAERIAAERERLAAASSWMDAERRAPEVASAQLSLTLEFQA